MFAFVFDESLFACVYDKPPFVFVLLYERAKTRPRRVHLFVLKMPVSVHLWVVFSVNDAKVVRFSKNLRVFKNPKNQK
jgi:hypothetical protein